MKVRRKPSEATACQVLVIINAWLSGVDEEKIPVDIRESLVERLIVVHRDHVTITTMHGPVNARFEDYVLVGDSGDVWPVTKAMFHRHYEVIER